MRVLKLILKNMLRHKLRTTLTVIGIAVTVLAFNLMRTVISSWNSGVQESAANRLATVQKVSFIYPLPLAYRDQILKLPGVKRITFANWFAGVYIDKNQFFARFAVEPETFFDVYPEYVITPEVRNKFISQRNACIVGLKTARDYKLKVGDLMNIDGDIYPGKWQMEIVGFYHGKNENIDETAMMFNWNYLNEQVKQTQPTRANHVGWYIEEIDNPANRASISLGIDNLFANSPAETKTQSEKEFQQSFVSMSGAIISAINIVSYVIIGIILLILTNTMVMTARERVREYAVLKTLGFSSIHIFGLIAGESLFISCIGGAIGMAVTFPACRGIYRNLPPGWFPVFNIEPMTIVFAVLTVILAGVISSMFPIYRALHMKIVDGLRQIG
ncbi:MAG: ABC transporter permease [Bacteroidota bacterium]